MNPDPTSLERLHDIVVPSPVALWPPAPGWYWVLAFLAACLAYGLFKMFCSWQKNRYRREALAELRSIGAAASDGQQLAAAHARLATLIKRTALSAFPRSQVAALTGDAWFAFLDRTAKTDAFSKGIGATLEESAYQTSSHAQNDEVAAHVRHWIKRHRVPVARGGST